MKKISAILLALLLTLFCAACGNDENLDKEMKETGKATTTVTDSSDPDTGDDEVGTEGEEPYDEVETEDEEPYDEVDDWEEEDCEEYDDEDHHSASNPEGNEVNENGGIITCLCCGEQMSEEESYDHQCDFDEKDEYITLDEFEDVVCFKCSMLMMVEDWQDHLNAYHGGSEWSECAYCHQEYSIREEGHSECTGEDA